MACGVDADLAWLLEWTRGERAHFPAAVWSPGPGFVMATPRYHDSAYVSASRGLFDAMVQAGLDVFRIDRRAPLPRQG